MRIGTNELLIILLIVVIVFGPTQIPKLTRMFGKSVKNFREGLDESDSADSPRKTADNDTNHHDGTES